jgi:hypothetical protein
MERWEAPDDYEALADRLMFMMCSTHGSTSPPDQVATTGRCERGNRDTGIIVFDVFSAANRSRITLGWAPPRNDMEVYR